MSILVQSLDIKVWIWGYKVKHIVLRVASPVFPSFVPSLYEYLIEAMLSSKINVALYVFCIGRVLSVAMCSARMATT